MISTLASPFSRECGNTRSRNAGSSAVSPCISPSTSSSGCSRQQNRSCRAHLARRRRVVAAEIGMRHAARSSARGRSGGHAPPPAPPSRRSPPRSDPAAHGCRRGRRRPCAVITSDSAAKFARRPAHSPMMSRMWRRWPMKAAFEAADHRVGIAARDRQRGDHGRVGAHQRARRVGRDAACGRRPRHRSAT